MIVFACPACSKQLKVKDELAGKRAKCPACGKPVTIPENRAAALSGSGKHSPVPQPAADVQHTLPPKAPAPLPTNAPTLPPVNPAAGLGETVNGGQNKTPTDYPAVGAEFLAPAQAPDEIGRLGTYRVLKVLGEGGMGTVFLAEDPHLERQVALKTMRPEMAAVRSARERFLREAKAAAALEHDHILPIYQVSEDRGVPYIAMPLLKGESLEDRLGREPPLSLADIVRIAREAAEGLAAADAKGLIHRDIKPPNLWLEPPPRSRLKILDFGLARQTQAADGLTQTGTSMGTPGYLAPEQAEGLHVDARADLFSLGVVLYRMLTGRLPYPGKTMLQFINSLVSENPPKPQQVNPDVPANLSALVMRLLAKNPEERPASAEVVATELVNIEATLPKNKSPKPAMRRPRRWALVATAAMLLIATALAGVVVIIKNREGKEVARVVVPEDGSIEVGLAEKGPAAVEKTAEKTPAPAKLKVEQTAEKSPVPPKVNAGKPVLVVAPLGALDRLDPANIPAAERFPWQPKELVAVLGEHKRRHTSSIANVAWSPDGKWIASVSSDGLYLLEAATLRPRISPGLNEGGGSGVAFSANGKVLAATMKRGVTLWDLSDTKIQERYTLPITGEKISLAADGETIAVLNDYTLFIYEITAAGPRLRTQINDRHNDWESALALAPDGKTVATVSKDGSVPEIWDVSVKEPSKKTVLGKHVPPYVTSMAYAPDGRVLAVIGGDSILRLWDITKSPPAELTAIKGGGARPKVTFSQNGRILAKSGGGLIEVFQWDGKAAKLESSLTGYGVISVALSPDGNGLVAVDAGTLRVWDRKANGFTEREPLGPAPRYACDFSPDGILFAASHHPEKGLSVWDFSGAEPRRSTGGYEQHMTHYVSFLSDSRSIFAYAGDRQCLVTLRGMAMHYEPLVEQWVLYCARVSADGKTMAALGLDGLVTFWDIARPVPKKKSTVQVKLGPNQFSYVRHFAVSPDLRTLAIGRADASVQLFDLATGKERAVIVGDANYNPAVAFSPDGKMLAFGGRDGQVHVRTGTEAGLPEKGLLQGAKSDRLYSLSFFPDGRLLAGSYRTRLIVWDLGTSEILHNWEVPANEFDMGNAVAVAADNRHLARVNGNGTVYFLRIGKPVAAPPPVEKKAGTLPPTFKNSTGIEFVLVPKGKSWLGGGGGKPGEKEVEFKEDFYLGKYEVTQEEWGKVMGTRPSHFSRTGGLKDAVKDISDEELKRFPVESVSWDDAQLFLTELNKRENEVGWLYRLPKETEWEYACRGGPMPDKVDSTSDFYFEKPSDVLLPDQANFAHGKGLKRTSKVGSYKPNRLALYDMLGNVSEWRDDLFDPKDPAKASVRVYRGGSWYRNSWVCRAANRDGDAPSERSNEFGLRVARVPVGK